MKGPRLIPVRAARELAQKAQATRIVILALYGPRYSVTTWGVTQRDCAALARWADGPAAKSALKSIAEADMDGGVVYVAHDPQTTGDRYSLMRRLYRRYGIYADFHRWPRYRWSAPGVSDFVQRGWNWRFRIWWGKPHVWPRAKLLWELNRERYT